MTLDHINAHLLDVGNLAPEGSKRSEFALTAIICSQPETRPGGIFAVGTTAAGKHVAVWAAHADLFDDLDSLKAALNVYELNLLALGVNLT